MTSRLITTLLAGGLLAAGLPATAGAAGGLSMSPPILEKQAATGSMGAVTITNSSSQPMRVTVTSRPWVQSRSGAVTPNRRRNLLREIRPSALSFSLAAGAKRAVDVRVLRVAGGGSRYASLEVIGRPPAKKQKESGIRAVYRLIGSLRLNPSPQRRRLRLQAGGVRRVGSGSRRAIVAAVRNAGNTIDPVTGTARITGPGGTRNVSIPARRILPGALVDVSLGSARGLRAGTYRARVSLFQAGRPVTTATRTFRIR